MLDPEAAELNETIKRANPYIYVMLSERGKRIFFPTKGILAQTAEARGKAINATIGTALEDCGKTMELPSVGAQISFEGDDIFSYAPNLGKPEIRKAWRKMMFRKNPGLKEGPGISTPVVTAALTHGLSATGYLFINRGDTIITPNLFWENYHLAFNYAFGSTFLTFPMFNDKGGFNTEALRQKLLDGDPGKKIVILNFPNNPTGYTITEEEAAVTRDIIVESAEKGNNLVVFIDDAYFGLVFEDGILRESMFAMLATAHERVLAVKVDGPTKEDYVWGMRVGFVTFGCKQGGQEFCRAMESKLGGSIRGSISSVSNIGQTMLLRAYENESYEQEKTEKFDILRRRYRKIKEILESRKEYAERFRPLPFNSGYFMCLEVISGKAEEIRKILLDRYDTGVIALGNLLRVAFSSTPYELLEKLFDNIYKAACEV
ncbi:MAG: aminotransferase class I/II-fold pyridoxal phosphate-dependent enzyme [Chitinispirillia bacterium]|nr:aminotransferase class I/II-fold pyridoxal phosphate-dependent enzyme [Chitinispirillia bacterium]MCL2267568.1 aminotransferase class I/II-fold pyridoxal phosphate-dependent enzyme [Chitinispirillia bacterium]